MFVKFFINNQRYELIYRDLLTELQTCFFYAYKTFLSTVTVVHLFVVSVYFFSMFVKSLTKFVARPFIENL